MMKEGGVGVREEPRGWGLTPEERLNLFFNVELVIER